MKIYFKGDISGLEEGIKILSKDLGFELDKDGTVINVKQSKGSPILVSKKCESINIIYSERIHFFRALGLIAEKVPEIDEFDIIEYPQFKTDGVMFDVSQGNAAINVSNIKGLIRKMAVMGLNMLMLYMEDNYEIEQEPYFGYMRGRYSYKELKECDDYAYNLGIEMIPCIQTLAHLIDALKWQCFSDIKQDDDTLLVGYERTYKFIEEMIKAAQAPFRSRRIHIGMDEAWRLGQGKYLLKNGYRSKFDIMKEHLSRVLKITEKYGLKPMIWSDMFFRPESKSGDDYYDTDSIIPDEVLHMVPDGVQLVYWDYYHDNEDFYKEWLRRHRLFGSEPIFAGGIWSWNGYCADYGKTFATMQPALNVCKKERIDEVFVTIWGDGGTESNIYSNLLGLQFFAEHGYSRELDMDKLKKRFKFCTGCNYDDFYNITYLDKIQNIKGIEMKDFNPSKYLMWQDILMGLFDKNISGLNLDMYYSDLKQKMSNAKNQNGEFGFLFEFFEKVCSVLSIKSEIGLKIKDAYDKKDYDKLKYFVSTVLPELSKRVSDLRTYHRKLWLSINKPSGWEVMDIRYGGLLMRIDSAAQRLSEYIEHKISNIEELDQEKLYFNGAQGLSVCNVYSKMPSANRISFTYGF